MTVINNEARLTALKRQKLLYELHCKHCINRNERNNVKYCPGCAIWDEFLKIGKVLDKTIAERIDTVRRLETSLGEISDILEGENVTPLVEQLAYVLTYSGIYNKD